MSRNRWVRLQWTILGVAVLIVGVVVALLLGNYDVVEKGQLLPYTDGRIYKIRFLDRFELYVEPENRPNADALTAFFLTGMGFMSLAFAWLAGRVGAFRPQAMFLILFAGSVFLAADEFLGLHESLGHNLPFLLAVPGVSRPDDVIVLCYVVIAIVVLGCFRSMLLQSARARAFFLAGVGLFAVAAVFDVANVPGEELLEVGAAALFVAAVAELGVTHLIGRDGIGRAGRATDD